MAYMIMKERRQLWTLQDLINRLPDLGSATAVQEYSQSGKSTKISYKRFAKLVDHMVDDFQRRKVSAESKVIIWAANSVDWLVACLAVIRCRAVIVPVDVQIDDKSLKHIIKDSGASLILTSELLKDRLDRLNIDAPDTLLLSSPGKARRGRHRSKTGSGTTRGHTLEPAHPDDIAAIFYTSGTTGLPKGVPLSHRNLVYQINTLQKGDMVPDAAVVLLPLPLHHIYPFTCGFLTCMSVGVPIVLPSELTGPSLAFAIQDSGATMVVGVPRLYSALLEAIERKVDSQPLIPRLAAKLLWRASTKLSGTLGIPAGKLLMLGARKKIGRKLQSLASGGAPLDPDVLCKLEALGLRVIVGYGLTETAPILTLNESGARRADSAGRAIPGVQLRIQESKDDSSDESSQSGEDGFGEVLVRSDGVFSGYHNLKEKSIEAFTEDGWFRTGDLGKIDGHGYLYLKGRLSTMFKTGAGEKIQAEDMEALFEKNPSIKELGILMDDDVLVALVVPNRPDRQSSAQAGDIEKLVKEAIDESNKKLASHQRVTRFLITNTPLPRTRLGKIRRQELIDLYHQVKRDKSTGKSRAAKPISIEHMSADDQALLRDPRASALWKKLADRYKDLPLSLDSNLHLDLNIDSLEWVSLSLELNTDLGVDLSGDDIRDITTVRDLLQRGASATKTGGKAVELPKLFEKPSALLKPEQKQWLKPLSEHERKVAHLLYAINRALVKGLFKVSAEGWENLPQSGPLILAPNHASYLDPFVIAAVLPADYLDQVHWAGWQGILLANWWNRFIARLSRSIPIDPFADIMSSLALAASVLKKDAVLVWFPEGERSLSGELISFKPGVGLLAQHLDVAILPAFIEGTHDALPPGKFLPRPVKVTVKFGHLVKPDELPDEQASAKKESRIVTALRSELEHLRSA